jgi:predicted lipoprotein with Yx(FWY)xxD motif
MNRILTLLCAMGLAFGLVACKGQAERDSEEKTTTTQNSRAGGPGTTVAQADDAGASPMGGADAGAAEMTAPTEQDDVAANLSVATKEPYGEYLTDGQGRSLYMFEADQQGGPSTCYDACVSAWPPLTVEPGQTANAGAQVDASLLSTIERKDGTLQVTYNGWPLYYFSKDQQPGDTLGQDVHGFGGGWYLLAPSGEIIEMK